MLLVAELMNEQLDSAKARIEFGNVTVEGADQEGEIFGFQRIIHHTAMVRGQSPRSSTHDDGFCALRACLRKMITGD